MRKIMLVLLWFCLLVGTGDPAAGATRATLMGTLLDGDGAPLPGGVSLSLAPFPFPKGYAEFSRVESPRGDRSRPGRECPRRPSRTRSAAQ